MTPEVSVALVVLVLLVVGVYMYGSGRHMKELRGVLDEARRTGEPQGIVDYVKSRGSGHEDLWDQALLQLWNSYDRQLAAQLLVAALAPMEKVVVEVGSDGCGTASCSTCSVSTEEMEIRILHYWVNQVLQIEPEVAAAVFTESFLSQSYRPELAMTCGAGCGCRM